MPFARLKPFDAICIAVLALPVAAQAQTMPPGRPLTTNDVAAGGAYMQFEGARENRDGSKEVTKHIAFPPMSFIPVITLSVTQIDVAATAGRIAYHVAQGDPVCQTPKAPDMQCTGFDIIVTAKPGTDIKEINVTWLAINGLNPALFANPTATITPR